MSRYKCPVCGFTAEIDQGSKEVKIELPAEAVSFPTPGHACELAKAVDRIDLSKLEKVE